MTKSIAVLRRGVHGLPVEDYAEAIRDRLPGYDVRLARTPEEEREVVGDASIVTGHSISHVLDHASDVRYFQALSAGTDHLPLDELASREVTVSNAGGVHASNAAEQAIGFMLYFARGLDEAARRTNRREWRHFGADELHGSTVTVVGLGHIGTAIAERLSAFGVDTIGVRHSPEKGGPTDEVIGYDDDLHDALVRTEYLVLACPLTETTEGLIDDDALRSLPSDAVLVNVARGKVVETDALVYQIRKNDLRAAALDVTDPEPLPEDHPLWTFENVLITPHNAGYTPKYYERVADILSENVDRIERTGEYDGLRNQVVP